MACTLKSHRLIHPSLPTPAAPVTRPAVAAGGIQWPSFTGTATLVGTSSDGRTTVYVDASLGAQALANAKALLADAPRINALDAGFFNTSGKVNVILFALGGATDGTGGADHGGCDYNTGENIEVCVAYGQDQRCSALYEAELSENDMNGNLCGVSTGEALSRLCAEYGIWPAGTNPLADFASTPSWVQAGYPNWVDRTQPSDGDYPSIGCGMCFLSWLRSQKYTIAQIAQAMVSLGDSGTLAQLYLYLNPTGPYTLSQVWPAFLAAAKALPSITTDDPFAGATPPQPPTGGTTGTLTVSSALPNGTFPVNGNAASLSAPTGLATGTYQVGTTAPPTPPSPSTLFNFRLARAKPAGYPLRITGAPAMQAGTYSVSHATAGIEGLVPALDAPDLSPWWGYLEQVLLKYGEQAVEQILKDILDGKLPKARK